jgi:hypothetical protein
MTSFSSSKRSDFIAADEFEARIERAFVKSEIVFTLDGEIIMLFKERCIQTSDEY